MLVLTSSFLKNTTKSDHPFGGTTESINTHKQVKLATPVFVSGVKDIWLLEFCNTILLRVFWSYHLIDSCSNMFVDLEGIVASELMYLTLNLCGMDSDSILTYLVFTSDGFLFPWKRLFAVLCYNLVKNV